MRRLSLRKIEPTCFLSCVSVMCTCMYASICKPAKLDMTPRRSKDSNEGEWEGKRTREARQRRADRMLQR